FATGSKKLPPPTTIQRGEQHLSSTDNPKPPPVPIPPIPPANDSKYKSSRTSGNTTASSNVKIAEPLVAPKPRATRELDEKWTDMFGSNKQDNSAKEDLLAKLVADEQQERKQAAATSQPARSTT
ncbi:unnamed protein product, partial [Adineta steineri]